MVRRQQLAHNPNYGSQVFAARPQATRASENVGRTMGSVAALFAEFMDSPSHRATILDGRLTHATTACTVDGNGQLWVAVNFWG